MIRCVAFITIRSILQTILIFDTYQHSCRGTMAYLLRFYGICDELGYMPKPIPIPNVFDGYEVRYKHPVINITSKNNKKITFKNDQKLFIRN